MSDDELGVCDGAAFVRRFVALDSAPCATPIKYDQDLDSDEEAAAADVKDRQNKGRAALRSPRPG